MNFLRMLKPILWVLIFSASGCSETTNGSGVTDGSVADVKLPGYTTDVPDKAGDLCPYGRCALGLVCRQGFCRVLCNKSDSCNSADPICGPNEWCAQEQFASTKLCLPADVETNGACERKVDPDPNIGNYATVTCPGGSFCVPDGSGATGPGKCRRLCGDGCPTGTTCQTRLNCKICVGN